MSDSTPRAAAWACSSNAPPPLEARGSHTRMEVALAVAKMCLDAGGQGKSSPCQCWGPSSGPARRLWRDLTQCNQGDQGVLRKDSGDEDSPKGVRLKSGKVRPELLDVDVLVNIPSPSHHVGTLFSGKSRNMMGGPRSRDQCVLFPRRLGQDWLRASVDFLSQLHRRPEYAAKAGPVRG